MKWSDLLMHSKPVDRKNDWLTFSFSWHFKSFLDMCRYFPSHAAVLMIQRKPNHTGLKSFLHFRHRKSFNALWRWICWNEVRVHNLFQEDLWYVTLIKVFMLKTQFVAIRTNDWKQNICQNLRYQMVKRFNIIAEAHLKWLAGNH